MNVPHVYLHVVFTILQRLTLNYNILGVECLQQVPDVARFILRVRIDVEQMGVRVGDGHFRELDSLLVEIAFNVGEVLFVDDDIHHPQPVLANLQLHPFDEICSNEICHCSNSSLHPHWQLAHGIDDDNGIEAKCNCCYERRPEQTTLDCYDCPCSVQNDIHHRQNDEQHQQSNVHICHIHTNISYDK